MNYFKLFSSVILLTPLFFSMNSSAVKPSVHKSLLRPYVEHFDCEDMTVAVGIIPTGVLDKIAGDCHFKDHSPLLTVNLILEKRGTRIMITGSVKIHEKHHDGTTFESTISKTILDLKDYDECHYIGVDEYEGQVRSEEHAANWEIERYNGSGFLEWIDCVSRVRGDNCGRLSCDLRIKPITIKLKSKY
jgi:hypothetical protein